MRSHHLLVIGDELGCKWLQVGSCGGRAARLHASVTGSMANVGHCASSRQTVVKSTEDGPADGQILVCVPQTDDPALLQTLILIAIMQSQGQLVGNPDHKEMHDSHMATRSGPSRA